MILAIEGGSRQTAVQGFHPEDFQRGRRTHPDIQPPGGGRGTDFDSMFG